MPVRGGRGTNMDGMKMERRLIRIFLPSIFLPRVSCPAPPPAAPDKRAGLLCSLATMTAFLDRLRLPDSSGVAHIHGRPLAVVSGNHNEIVASPGVIFGSRRRRVWRDRFGWRFSWIPAEEISFFIAATRGF